jgi:hypothetical protein
MIAQRKPNNDKGFEDFAMDMRVFWGVQTFSGYPPPQISPSATFFPRHALRGANAAYAQTPAWQAFAATPSSCVAGFSTLVPASFSLSPFASRSS